MYFQLHFKIQLTPFNLKKKKIKKISVLGAKKHFDQFSQAWLQQAHSALTKDQPTTSQKMPILGTCFLHNPKLLVSVLLV